MEIALTLLIGAAIVVTAYTAYNQVRAKYFPHTPALFCRQTKGRRVQLSPAEEQRLWEDLVQRLKKNG